MGESESRLKSTVESLYGGSLLSFFEGGGEDGGCAWVNFSSASESDESGVAVL